MVWMKVMMATRLKVTRKLTMTTTVMKQGRSCARASPSTLICEYTGVHENAKPVSTRMQFELEIAVYVFYFANAMMVKSFFPISANCVEGHQFRPYFFPAFPKPQRVQPILKAPKLGFTARIKRLGQVAGKSGQPRPS